MTVIADIIGTLRTTFRIAKATFDASSLTAARMFTLQDQAGTLGHLAQTIHNPAGRLTLESGLGVSPTDQTAKTSVFYTPYAGDLVPLYNGTIWTPTVFTELTLALATSGTNFQAASTNYDLFVVNDAGTIRLGTGPAWTSATARGTGAGTTEIERKNGIWTNKVSMTLRWGSASGNTITVAANQGTYVGTMRAPANGQAEDSLVKRFLWNMYNRVTRPMFRTESTDSWTYTTKTWRQMNNSAANQLDMVRGLDEDVAHATARFMAGTISTALMRVYGGIGLDSITAFVGHVGTLAMTNAFSIHTVGTAEYFGLPGLGRHFLAALEQSDAISTTTWYGDAGAPLDLSAGIHGEVFA